MFQVVASDPDDPTQPSGQIYYSIQQSDADAKVFAIGKYPLLQSESRLDLFIYKYIIFCYCYKYNW